MNSGFSKRNDDPDDDEDEEEAMMSMLHVVGASGRRGLSRMEIRTGPDDHDHDHDDAPLFSWRWALLILGVMALAAVTVVISSRDAPNPQSLVDFTCPAYVPPAANVDQASFEEHYVNETLAMATNITEFLHTFREAGFDNWGHTYEEVKQGMYSWKSTHFPPNLHDGDSIYESACGVGLNLYMTLEILHDVKGVESLAIYGNEYLPVSAEKANAVFDHMAPFHSVKGTICTGDSLNLQYVPSDAFDLVYTGYISPIYDPLQLDMGIDKGFSVYEAMCKADKDDWKSLKLAEMAQKIQNDFYGRWVSEMVRIAKPGKAIIIEQVSKPLCDAFFDWGGVAKDWWQLAIDEYHWDVDPESVVMDKDKIFTDRYHVFMRKNSAIP